MNKDQFENLLETLCEQLTKEAEKAIFKTSKEFEDRVRDVLQTLVKKYNFLIDYNPHPFAFPDIAVGEFGIEVKFTTKDTWRSVANSVNESFRSQEVIHIYVVFGKMGGVPKVKWQKYEDAVIHVRTSHVPRFELEIDAKSSLFKTMGISYAEFSVLPIEQKMQYIRKYAKSRLKDGERLWWLEEKAEQEHSLPIEVRLYIDLPSEEKRKLRAEAILLSPKIVGGSRVKNKYNDVALFLLTYHGVLASQARDLFSAGSVAMASDKTRGGNYIQRSIQDIEQEIIEASLRMEDALFVEYWGVHVAPKDRVKHWLQLADKYADGWTPSQSLFLKGI
ncbi:MAG: restriction endonuclease [Bacteroidia bacterium]